MSYFLTTTGIRDVEDSVLVDITIIVIIIIIIIIINLETSKTAFSSTSSAWSGGPQKGSRQLPFILQCFTFTEDFFFWTSIYSVPIQGANAIKGLTAKVRLVHISLFFVRPTTTTSTSPPTTTTTLPSQTVSNDLALQQNGLNVENMSSGAHICFWSTSKVDSKYMRLKREQSSYKRHLKEVGGLL